MFTHIFCNTPGHALVHFLRAEFYLLFYVLTHLISTAFHPSYRHVLPETHRFPMEKYDLLKDQLIHEGLIEVSDIIVPTVISEEAILRCHNGEYLQKLQEGRLSRNEERQSGFPWSLSLIKRERIIMEGTRLCGRIAAKGHVAMNIAGGTHHAHAAHAEGFCLLNDLVIAAHDLLALGLERILIVDLDVHQGNGTARMTEDDPRVFSFSMHGASNYPLRKAQSNLDVALPDGTGDGVYLHRLAQSLDEVMSHFLPEVVLYQCGVDVLDSDRLGHLSLTLDGCARRDKMVFDACRTADIGILCAMGGGYSKNVSTIVRAHTNTFRMARDCWT